MGKVKKPTEPFSPVTEVPFRLPFWITSDSHFFHRNIVEYCGRPDNHDRLMREGWQETVGENETIVHLGDLAMNKPEKIEELMPELPGKKYMIMGNHDRKGKGFYKRLGFHIVKPFELDYKGWRVVFTHYPDYENWFVSDERTLNVHGHIHEKLMDNRRCINVSVEHTNYKPIRITDVLDKRIAELEG